MIGVTGKPERIEGKTPVTADLIGGKDTLLGLIKGKPTGPIKTLEDWCPVQPFEEHKKLSTISLG